MATGVQPKELGINYLVLCENTKTQKVLLKSMTMRAKLGLVVTENCYYNDFVYTRSSLKSSNKAESNFVRQGANYFFKTALY